MDKFLLKDKNLKIHFTGIGGVSMSGIAHYLAENGFTVSGSDINKSDYTLKLSDLGVRVFYKHSPANLKQADMLIYTSAINEANPEIKFAKRKKLPIIKRSEILGEILRKFKRSVAVSGSHGKTTATSMIADVFILADINPTVFLGGESNSFGNYCSGQNDVAIAEACEYKQNFLDLNPDVAVILNIDNDHTDFYEKEEDIVCAFKKFSENALTVLNADDKHSDELFSCTTVTFGIEKRANFTAKNIKYNGKGYSFTACAYDRPVGRIDLSVIGKHNVYNALAAFSVAQIFNIPFSTVKYALENFKGIKRRCEYLGKINGKECFADYAHHPREITATLQAFRDSGNDFAVVFQPHTYSRTKSLMSDFIESLKNENLIIFKTYPARENFDKDGCEKTLFENLLKLNSSAMLALNDEQLKSKILELDTSVKRILFLGAGDIYESARKLTTL